MTRRTVVVVIGVLSLIVCFLIGNGTAPSNPAAAEAQTVPGSFAAVPGEKGGMPASTRNRVPSELLRTQGF